MGQKIECMGETIVKQHKTNRCTQKIVKTPKHTTTLKQKNPFVFFILDLVLALLLPDSKEAAPPFFGYSNTMILSSVPGVAAGSPQSVIAL